MNVRVNDDDQVNDDARSNDDARENAGDRENDENVPLTCLGGEFHSVRHDNGVLPTVRAAIRSSDSSRRRTSLKLRMGEREREREGDRERLS